MRSKFRHLSFTRFRDRYLLIYVMKNGKFDNPDIKGSVHTDPCAAERGFHGPNKVPCDDVEARLVVTCR